jgi:hypothetical protein
MRRPARAFQLAWIRSRACWSRIKAGLAEFGGTALAGSPAEFGAFIAAETEKWGKVVTFAGLKPD